MKQQIKELKAKVAFLTTLNTIQKKLDILKNEVAQLKPTPKLGNIDTVTDNQKQEIVAAPTKPTTTTPPPDTAAGITMPHTTQEQGMNTFLSGIFSKNTAALGLSLLPGIGEAYDSVTLYTGIDPITKEVLNYRTPSHCG